MGKILIVKQVTDTNLKYLSHSPSGGYKWSDLITDALEFNTIEEARSLQQQLLVLGFSMRNSHATTFSIN